MNGWMDEWMNGWMDEWMNGWMDDRMNKLMNHAMQDHSRTDNTQDKWIDEWINGWMDEWMNGWIDEWMNKWMNEWITMQDHSRTNKTQGICISRQDKKDARHLHFASGTWTLVLDFMSTHSRNITSETKTLVLDFMSTHSRNITEGFRKCDILIEWDILIKWDILDSPLPPPRGQTSQHTISAALTKHCHPCLDRVQTQRFLTWWYIFLPYDPDLLEMRNLNPSSA